MEGRQLCLSLISITPLWVSCLGVAWADEAQCGWLTPFQQGGLALFRQSSGRGRLAVVAGVGWGGGSPSQEEENGQWRVWQQAMGSVVSMEEAQSKGQGSSPGRKVPESRPCSE